MPFLQLRNSPIITPIKESDKLSFNDDVISTLLDGIISFRIISFLVAPNTLNSLILSLSVLINPFKIVPVSYTHSPSPRDLSTSRMPSSA